MDQDGLYKYAIKMWLIRRVHKRRTARVSLNPKRIKTRFGHKGSEDAYSNSFSYYWKVLVLREGNEGYPIYPHCNGPFIDHAVRTVRT